MQLGTDLKQDILLLRFPPLLFREKRKFKNDVDHKTKKLSLEPRFSKSALAPNGVKYHRNLWVLDSSRPGISASHTSNTELGPGLPIITGEVDENHVLLLKSWSICTNSEPQKSL